MGAGEAEPAGGALEIRLLGGTDAAALGRLFERIVSAGGERWFHPHPLDASTAALIAARPTLDLYYVVRVGQRVIAYGMLRGWDEGYEIPSLGIAVDPEMQHQGLGRMFMGFLHAAAVVRGCRRVRLTVDEGNDGARRLYERLGYSFTRTSDGRWIGHLDLRR